MLALLLEHVLREVLSHVIVEQDVVDALDVIVVFVEAELGS